MYCLVFNIVSKDDDKKFTQFNQNETSQQIKKNPTLYGPKKCLNEMMYLSNVKIEYTKIANKKQDCAQKQIYFTKIYIILLASKKSEFVMRNFWHSFWLVSVTKF
eukprot:TRINITY_DN67624_c0_g1_i1.p2 TRINITY_DN67624_c0_g1~~TRINITY_DN67624_c0_g1_i1.p2  ORF type:complete len:105 (+),score=4.17 TRINITY_DN67624_c0_g1_i1:131-445(+)